MDMMNIRIALPHNDFYNGDWNDVVLHDVERKDYVGVDFFPHLEDQISGIQHFQRKYVTIVGRKR